MQKKEKSTGLWFERAKKALDALKASSGRAFFAGEDSLRGLRWLEKRLEGISGGYE